MPPRARTKPATADPPPDDEPLPTDDPDAPGGDTGADVPDELVFTTPEDDTEPEDNPWVPFQLDGRVYRARRPKTTVLVSLLAATSDEASLQDQAQAVLTWIRHCLDQPSRAALSHRLYDYDDKLQFEHLADVMWTMLERWDEETRAATGTRDERRAADKALKARKAAAAKTTAGRARVATGRRR